MSWHDLAPGGSGLSSGFGSGFEMFILKLAGEEESRLVDGWYERWSEKWSELNEKQRRIIALMEMNARISRKELSEALNINQSAVQKYIEKLKKKGLIRRVGPAKGGHWEVVEK